MKLWVSILLVLVFVNTLEAKRRGRKREWRREKYAELQANRQGSEVAEAGDDDIKDDDEDAQKNNVHWSSKKERKWAMKHERKMKWMNKRRQIISPADDNTEETTSDDAQVNTENSYPMDYHRRWQQKGENTDKWRQKKRMMKKWHHKKHGKGPSCICHLKTEQLEKLRELITKAGLEDEFPQIVSRSEGDPVNDNDEATQITNDTDDVE